MSRSINATLENALATQQGDIILRVLTWTDQADYVANPTTPDHTWETKKFFIDATSADVELVTANDYTLSAFSVFIIERGVKLVGVEYTVKSGLFFVKTYQEDYGKIKLHGSSYPNLKVSIAAGDGTYQAVIEAFCTAIGKTAVFKISTDPWLSYQFLPTGKSLSLNKAELFESMLKQKYTILMYEESPGNLVFYNQDSYTTFPDNIIPKGLSWSPELNLFVSVFQATTSQIWTSPNGIDWTFRHSALELWARVTWSPSLGLFCLTKTSGTNRVMTSPDGITWTNRATANDSIQWTDITWSSPLGLFCACGINDSGNSAIMTSTNGINWTSRTPPAGTTDFSNISWSTGLALFCIISEASGADNSVISSDGINWSKYTVAAVDLLSITSSSSLFIASSYATIYTSLNGQTWTLRSTPATTGFIQSMAWSPTLNLFCAVANTNTVRCITSPDGITWTARTIPSREWRNIAWSPELSLFCALSYDGASAAQSADGITWTELTTSVDFNLTYEDGPASHIVRDQASVHYLWRDEAGTPHTLYDTTLPQWNLGFLKSTATAPTTHQDAYYKIFLQKAPVRLDITDGDKIHFTPYWSIDPTKTVDAMMQVSEHLDLKKSPSWYQEIKSVSLFSYTEGGMLPSAIERVAAYTPLVSTGFDGNLTPAVNNLQAFAEAVDGLILLTHPQIMARVSSG